MRGPVEDPVVVGADGFINAVAVEKPVIKNGNTGKFFIDDAVLKKDLHFSEGTV
jgi:hypothetical protein